MRAVRLPVNRKSFPLIGHSFRNDGEREFMDVRAASASMEAIAIGRRHCLARGGLSCTLLAHPVVLADRPTSFGMIPWHSCHLDLAPGPIRPSLTPSR